MKYSYYENKTKNIFKKMGVEYESKELGLFPYPDCNSILLYHKYRITITRGNKKEKFIIFLCYKNIPGVSNTFTFWSYVTKSNPGNFKDFSEFYSVNIAKARKYYIEAKKEYAKMRRLFTDKEIEKIGCYIIGG